MKKITKWGLGFLCLWLLMLAACSAQTINMKKYTASRTTTLYVHGYGGSVRSTNHMINAAVDAHAATKALVADVSKTGRITWHGRWSNKADNPIVQVAFQNSKAPVDQNTKWLTAILEQLYTKYHVRTFNGVGHSNGSVDLIDYAVTSANNRHVPKLNKLVTIAGPFDGITFVNDKPNTNYFEKDGRPKHIYTTYADLLSKRQNFPHHVKILNIYGNQEDGSNSDGDVSTVSARSLQYLLRDKTASYQEKEITGKHAQHSQLHENSTVDHAVIQFLWGK
ncbi:alpha/beta hydrolase [Lactobacillus selangorensis]|nr:alpha/beta hydrolase [Lactobacillus selangorensis]